jgi:ABC-type iron transport system FetAB ATPase subunit
MTSPVAPAGAGQQIINGMVTNLNTIVDGTTQIRGKITNSNLDASKQATLLSTEVTPLEQKGSVLGGAIKGIYDFTERIMRSLGVG